MWFGESKKIILFQEFGLKVNYSLLLITRITRGQRKQFFMYSETLNNKYVERIHQMSYSSLSDNGMLPIFSFKIK